MENQKHQYTALYERTNHVSGGVSEPNGILAQKKLLTEYVKFHDFSDIKHYSDEGISGNKFDRPALNELLNDVRNGNIDTVVVKNLSRIGRNIVEVIRLVKDLENYGVRLISISDEIDTFAQMQKGGSL